MTDNTLLTQADRQAYAADGFVIKRHYFSPPEIELLYRVATDDSVRRHAFDLNDQTGRKTKLTLWFTPGDDTFGLMSRSERMVAGVAQLLGAADGVCHFHSKIMQKEPKVGGAWEWHQDYGYWYKNGFLYPEAMLSVMVALTEATRENGCLQVLRGSHRMGRFEHTFVGEQQGADPAFVDEASKCCELIYCALQPGDALFFHPNLLHRSEANLSDKPRWSVISAYNLAYNKPFREKNTSCITPVQAVPDTAILESGVREVQHVDFLRKEQEITLNVKS